MLMLCGDARRGPARLLLMWVLNSKTNDNALCVLLLSSSVERAIYKDDSLHGQLSRLLLVQRDRPTSTRSFKEIELHHTFGVRSHSASVHLQTHAARAAPSAAASDFDFGTWGPLHQMPLSCSTGADLPAACISLPLYH
jgi:hypothetical protein